MQCPSCAQPFQVTPEMAGHVVECPACGSAVAIPEIPQETSAPPAPEPSVHQCPACSRPFGVTPDMEGERVACPHCEQEVLIEITASKTDPTKPELQGQEQPNREPSEEMFAPGFTSSSTTTSQPKKSKSSDQKTKPPRFKGQPTPQASDQEISPPAGLPPTSVTADESDLVPADTSATQDAAEKTGLPTFHEVSKSSGEADTPAAEPTAESPDEQTGGGSATSEGLAYALSALPTPFLVEDPERISNLQSRRNTKVVLPDSSEGTRQLDQRLVKIQYKGETVELISRTPEEQARYRRLVNLVSMLIGLMFIVVAFVILLW